MFTRTAIVGMLLVGLGACADDGPRQATASTVATSAGVPRCDVGALAFSTAADGSIQIRNAGTVQCEVDVSDSPNRDPSMEPSVWLASGDEAEVSVAADDTQCERPGTITAVDLVVNGEPVKAPVSVTNACGVTLTAIFTAD
jgi:hypothetical protein